MRWTINMLLVLGVAAVGAVVFGSVSRPVAAGGGNKMSLQKLSKEERHVIIDKGTERPFSGKYVDHAEEGIYCCRQCGAGLYRSDSKFDSNCGWPAFDDYIFGTVKMQSDADGRRTEIVCVRCAGHLGHVFYGEKFTERDTRHCVNSISMQFMGVDEMRTALLAAGCFWGVEFKFQSGCGQDIGNTLVPRHR